MISNLKTFTLQNNINTFKYHGYYYFSCYHSKWSGHRINYEGIQPKRGKGSI